MQITGQVTQRGLSFLFFALATRVLGPAGVGVYSQVARVLSIGGQLGLAGFNYAAMRFIARARATGDHAAVRGAARVSLGAVSVASIIVTVVLVVAADSITTAFLRGDEAAGRSQFARFLLIGGAYIPLFALMQVLRYCTQAYKTMGPSVMVGNIIQPAARFVLGVGALLAGFHVAGAVATLALSMGVGAAAGAWYWRRMPTTAERGARPSMSPGPMIRFALPQAGSSLLGIQSLGLGVIVLGVISDNRDVGLFAIALALQGPGGVFLSGIVNIWAPVVSDLYERGELERLDSLYKTVTRWVMTFSFPVYAAVIVEPDLFVRVYGGPKALPAAEIAAILALGNLFYSGTGPTGYVLSMTGRPGINFANSVVAVGLYVVAGVIFVPRYGLIAMAWVDAAVTAVVNLVRVVEAKIMVGVQPFGRSCLKPLGATAAGVVVLLSWRLISVQSLWWDALGIAVGAGVYLVVLRMMGLDPEERHVWERIKKRLVKRRS